MGKNENDNSCEQNRYVRTQDCYMAMAIEQLKKLLSKAYAR